MYGRFYSTAMLYSISDNYYNILTVLVRLSESHLKMHTAAVLHVHFYCFRANIVSYRIVYRIYPSYHIISYRIYVASNGERNFTRVIDTPIT